MSETVAPGILFLLPNLLADGVDHHQFLPKSIGDAVVKLDGVIAETPKEARKFLKRFTLKKPLQEMPVLTLNEHTKPEEIKELLLPLQKGENWGIVSDAGLPCIADPGAQLVRLAHQKGIQVEALVGPCSLIMALMLSGFSGQRFCFHGYLPREPKERQRQMLLFEENTRNYRQTQIFIETPYRNQYVLQDFITTLQNDTLLCVVWDLTLPTQGVISKTVGEWKKLPNLVLEDKPAVFLLSF